MSADGSCPTGYSSDGEPLASTGTGSTGSGTETGTSSGATTAGTITSGGATSGGSSGGTQGGTSESSSAPFTDFTATFYGAGPNGSVASGVIGTLYEISTQDEMRKKYNLAMDKEKGIVVPGTDRSYTVEPLTSTKDAGLTSISVRPHGVNPEMVVVTTQNSDNTGRIITFKDGKAVEIQATSFVPGQKEPVVWNYNDDVIDALNIKIGSNFLKTGSLPVVDRDGSSSVLIFREVNGVTAKSVAMTTDGAGIVEILITNSDYSVERVLMEGSRVGIRTCHTPPPESKETPCK